MGDGDGIGILLYVTGMWVGGVVSIVRVESFLELLGFPMKRADQYLQLIMSMEPSDFRRWRERKKWEIFLHHFEHNPFYRNLVRKMPERWEEIPVMTKAHFQAPISSLLAEGFSIKDVYVGNTSGSSGHPFFYAKDKFAHALSWAVIKHLYGQHRLTLDSKQARFYGIPLERKGYWRESVKDWMMNRVRFPVFDLSDPVMDKWLRRFERVRFEYIYGYTSSLVYFARYCMEKGVVLRELCPTLRICIVTSEVCTSEDRKVLQRGFGVPVIDEYGASETGIIAFEDREGNRVLNGVELFIEVIDRQNHPLFDGKAGKILVTSLHNRAFPLIRYEIGDIGVVKEVAGKRALQSILGRTNDFVRLPSGRVSPGLTFYYISRSLLEGQGFIKEFIIKQVSLDTFEFVIHGTRKITDRERNEIQKCMDRYLEPGLKLVITEVDRIERPLSGKIKHFYSLLGDTT